MFVPNGRLYYDTPVGVLCLDTQFAKPVGQLRNPLTFPFPVVCRVLPGIGAAEIFAGSAKLGETMVETARQLEKDGVQAIAGSCGFMALYQKQVAAAVRVPVLMSSLMQLPLIKALHGEGCRLGVLTAQSRALTREHFRQAGVSDALYDSLLIRGMENSPISVALFWSAQPQAWIRTNWAKKLWKRPHRWAGGKPRCAAV